MAHDLANEEAAKELMAANTKLRKENVDLRDQLRIAQATIEKLMKAEQEPMTRAELTRERR